MPVTLTVGTNTYISLADADVYFNERLNADAWNAATDENKSRALITATRLINALPFKGKPKLSKEMGQTFPFPRCYPTGSYGFDYIANLPEEYSGVGWTCQTAVPQEVTDACCEEALAQLDIGDNKRRKLQQQGVISYTIGPRSETFSSAVNGSGNSSSLLSNEAKVLLRPYIAGAVTIK